MKSVLSVLAVLSGILFSSGKAAAPQAPASPPAAQPANARPIIESGGLDDRCQLGITVPYNFGEEGFGANDAQGSAAASAGSTCVGYIAGWSQTLSGAYIMEGGSLWFVEISDTMSPTRVVKDLHAFLVAHPDARTVPSPLVLLKVAVDEGVARMTRVRVESSPPGQRPREQARRGAA